tara:strand:- start:2117 stop:3364 length:1248 start_codon:yes stop_codon:yes gene_type:complete
MKVPNKPYKSQYSLLLALFWLPISVIVVFSIIGNTSISMASSDDIYRVSGVKLDVTSVSSATAKKSAFSEGHLRALKEIYRRLVLKSDIPKLPADELTLQDVVLGFEIENEKLSSTRYRANLTVFFSPEALRQLLRKHDVRFAESQSAGVIIIPVLLRNGQPLLWSEPNLWLKSWTSRAPDTSLLPVYSPFGDAQDLLTLRDSGILDAPVNVLRKFAYRYGVKNLVVAIIDTSYLEERNLGLLVSQIIDQSEPKAFSSSKDIDKTLPLPSGEFPIVLRQVSLKDDRITKINLESDGTKIPEVLFQETVDIVVNLLREEWKEANLLRFDQENELHLSVSVDTGIRQWLRINKILHSIPIIMRISISELSKNSVHLVINYLGDIDQLAEELENRDLELAIDKFGWKIREIDAIKEVR